MKENEKLNVILKSKEELKLEGDNAECDGCPFLHFPECSFYEYLSKETRECITKGGFYRLCKK